MVLKPETRLHKAIETLERHKEMLDVLIAFLKNHPKVASECKTHQLQGKLGLKFEEYALVVPYMKKGGGFVLKLVKSGDDWNNVDYEELYDTRIVAEDVSGMLDDELQALLERVFREANPEGDEEDENGE